MTPMNVPPDQFQRRTYVKLPFSDSFARSPNDPALLAELRVAFRKPLLYRRITARASEARATARATHHAGNEGAE